MRSSWRYLEHDWVATEGMSVFEPPGETHTLVVDSADEMITQFHVSGALIDVNDQEETCGCDDVHKKIDMCREHDARNGLSESYVEQFVRKATCGSPRHRQLMLSVWTWDRRADGWSVPVPGRIDANLSA